ncbi:MAG: anhydro-N-acetylmuramic acid kinase [Pseudonocardia sp.]|nr:anhydro-N-acetylmuramic acid kinase [Pseudonocardia sp.]
MIVVGLLSGTSMDGLDVAVAEIEIAGGVVRLTPLGAHTTPWSPRLREAWITERTGLPVVSDIRGTDIAAGGHGAPLASTLDALWLAGPRRRAALNLGGIANITVVGPPGEPVVSFDTGPGNCLLDVLATRTGTASGTAGTPGYDVDGALAAAGTVDPALLAELLAEKYYAAEPPKSTGRELFTAGYLDSAVDSALLAARHRGHGTRRTPNPTAPDIAATLVALTAHTVADACARYGVTEVVGSGGGMHNPVLVGALRTALDPVPLRRSAELGLPVDAKEAYLTALLGALSWHGVPGVLPGATGSRTSRVLGRFSPGHRPLRLPDPAGPVHTLQIT